MRGWVPIPHPTYRGNNRKMKRSTAQVKNATTGGRAKKAGVIGKVSRISLIHQKREASYRKRGGKRGPEKINVPLQRGGK